MALVTQASFARHFGIDKSVFNGWVRRDATGATYASQTPEYKDKDKAQSLARLKPQVVIDAIMELPESQVSEIFHEIKLRREGEDRTPRRSQGCGSVRQSSPVPRAVR